VNAKNKKDENEANEGKGGEVPVVEKKESLKAKATRKALESGQLLTREEAAKRIRLSVGEFRRLQRLKEIMPATKGSRKELLFRVQDVDNLVKHSSPSKSVEYAPAEASMVFEAMSRGLSAIQCVIELSLRPPVVEALAVLYSSMNLALYIPAPVVEAITRMDLDGPLPLKTPEDLLEVLRILVGRRCLSCGERAPHLCKVCVKKLVKKAEAELKSGDDEID